MLFRSMVGEGFVRDRLLLRASALTYFSVLSIVPLLAIVGSVVTALGVTQNVVNPLIDRIATVATNLSALGVEVEELDDGLIIQGVHGRLLSGRVRAWHDHRIAMAFSVLGAATGGGIEVDDLAVAAVSFPGFHRLLSTLTAHHE